MDPSESPDGSLSLFDAVVIDCEDADDPKDVLRLNLIQLASHRYSVDAETLAERILLRGTDRVHQLLGDPPSIKRVLADEFERLQILGLTIPRQPRELDIVSGEIRPLTISCPPP